MNQRIRRARNIDKVMTVIFYAIAVFFFVLLAAFAGTGNVCVCTKGKYRKPVV